MNTRNDEITDDLIDFILSEKRKELDKLRLFISVLDKNNFSHKGKSEIQEFINISQEQAENPKQKSR